ncbi:unnamed protein product [Bursaphelenchus xylophilus]|uniref:Phospholipid-transporting ATPase n=1 Tax=Bursaphelenchus xylophilus TaxID=6326 RepID=A0A811L1Z3_BURXY|nr:unnamed protein product [Bursaphelenchus xylophilus]CAG9108809.1 unnamed protein product [Bursaphelenchus xylophilus]
MNGRLARKLFEDWCHGFWFLNLRDYSVLSQSSGSTTSNMSERTLPRRIIVNSGNQSHKFCSNEISTCKYNAFTFLPRFLLEQFRRYSNVFFLVIALLQQIPDVSPTGRLTTAVPFLIILSLSALKEIFEDIKRRRMDSMVNNYSVFVLRGNEWVETWWRNVAVGEVVKLEAGDAFPADLILLSSSEPQGMAYIETSSLDGETNLKIRQALPSTAHLINIQMVQNFDATIECEPPNRHLNEFTGKISTEDVIRPLSLSQLLLRGSKLKNTKWIIGCNSKTAPLKRSNIDTLTNRRIIVFFVALVLLALISASGAEVYNHWYLKDAEYIPQGSRGNFAYNVLTFFILYNNLIPISLQITLELVRVLQAVYINNDIEMYDPRTDCRANARTSNLNEELGQVKFLMTDKTGTLTQNVMKFKRCSVGGVNYGDDTAESFTDTEILRHFNTNQMSVASPYEFFLAMAVCHTVVPERDSDTGEIIYQASSPDEGALVKGAASQGFVFTKRTPDSVSADVLGNEVTLRLLNVLEFNSDRKRMSVVMKFPDGTIKLYCKGADNVIMERLSPNQDRDAVVVMQDHLMGYAKNGYRTLCFAVREVSESEYQKWNKKYESASLELEDRDKKLAEVAEMIEKDLYLVGASAIEDKLQDFVPETIQSMMQADIRVWMLTGDKRETAINIAQSSALCTKNTRLLILDKAGYDEVLSKLESFIEAAKNFQQMNIEFALVISGGTLQHAMVGEARQQFAALAWLCRAVVCCRMTPMQKAEVVELVRSFGDHIVLAIGDGANDVAMIQAANVGVGITGEEGLRAASASDYSIAQFHFLRRLLLVHGTWNFERSVKVILYSFYKNICLYIIELWFAFFSAFSGQTIFDRWTIALFNVFFTAWSPVIIGLFDRPISARTMMKHSSLYNLFQQRAFSTPRFVLWIVISLWHSLLLFYLSYTFFVHEIVWESGQSGGWLVLGNACYTYVVVTVCLKGLLECDTWTFAILLATFGSIFIWFLFLTVYSFIWPTIPVGADMRGVAWILYTSPVFWMGLVFIPATTLLADYVIRTLQTTFFPSPREIINLKEKGQLRNEIYVETLDNLAPNHYMPVVSNANTPSGSRGGGGLDASGYHSYGSVPGRRRLPLQKSPQLSGFAVYLNSGASVTGDDSREQDPSRANQRLASAAELENQANYGFAFSQEENGNIRQSELIGHHTCHRV